MTLFDKYGGVPTVTLIVRAFYKEVLSNYKLKPYFVGIDAERLINHQIGFISHLLGKPANIHVEKVLSDSHKGRRISEDAFDEEDPMHYGWDEETISWVLISTPN